MDKKIVMWLVGYLMQKLKEEDMKELMDKGLDWLEDRIQEEPDKFDDLFLSALKILRVAISVPDND